jgi:hypothetical protein
MDPVSAAVVVLSRVLEEQRVLVSIEHQGGQPLADTVAARRRAQGLARATLELHQVDSPGLDAVGQPREYADLVDPGHGRHPPVLEDGVDLGRVAVSGSVQVNELPGLVDLPPAAELDVHVGLLVGRA